MTPRTRSGGVAPPTSSIIYKTSPKLKQVQFPARRKTVRTYGRRGRRRDGSVDKRDGEDDSSALTTAALKQKTLTQYDFAPSFNEDSVVELSDASDAEMVDDIGDSDEAEKENTSPNIQKASTRKRTAPQQPRKQNKTDEGEESRVQGTEPESDGQDDKEDGHKRRKRRHSLESANGTKTRRRRTLGEEHRMSSMRKSKNSRRRRTLGDSPVMTTSSRSSRYHTQTLTQFIGRTTSFVADSEDDGDLGNMENDGFLEWLGDSEPQTPSKAIRTSKQDSILTVGAGTTATAAVTTITADHSPSPYRRTRRKLDVPLVEQPREESVVPQTPAKTLRFDVPPSARHISPSPSRIAAVYGAPSQSRSPSSKRCGKMSSPLKPPTELMGRPAELLSPATKKPALVIQDSYATEGWSSVGGTQARQYTPSQTQTEVFSTPAEEMVTNKEAAVTQTPIKESRLQDRRNLPPAPTQTQDGYTDQEFFGAVSQIAQDSTAASQQEQEQGQKEEDRQQQPLTSKSKTQKSRRTSVMREIPDSDGEEGDFNTESDANEDEDDAEESRFAAGAETQLLMDQLHSSVRKGSGMLQVRNATSSSVTSPHPPPLLSSPGAASPSSAITSQSVPSSSTKAAFSQKQKQRQRGQQTPQQKTKTGIITNDIPIDYQGTPLRRPLHHQEPVDTQGVPLESQRVPVATLQGFTPATPRTDILLPLSRRTLTNLLSGHQDAIVLPFKVPLQVVRFWLIHDGLLRHLACVSTPENNISSGGRSESRYNPKQENGRGGQGTWTYAISQVYELNNAVTEADMRDEDWIHGQVMRYSYFPPAIVNQLLWNLRQALFATEHDAEHAATATPAAAAAGIIAFSSSPQQQQRQQTSSKKSTPRVNSQRGNLESSPSRATRPPPPSTMPAPPPPKRHSRMSKSHTQLHFVRPSQATTVSQASSVADIPGSPGIVIPGTAAAAAVLHHRLNLDESSESLIFDDHGGSSIPMLCSIPGLEQLEASQLLTKSQTLPESLIRDEERLPDEIWDSEDGE